MPQRSAARDAAWQRGTAENDAAQVAPGFPVGAAARRRLHAANTAAHQGGKARRLAAAGSGTGCVGWFYERTSIPHVGGSEAAEWYSSTGVRAILGCLPPSVAGELDD